MFRDRRWFVIDCNLSNETIRENEANYLRVIRYYRNLKLKKAKKRGITDFNQAMSLPLDSGNTKKHEEDIHDLLDWWADNMPFESRRGDWIKNELWELIGY